MNNVKQGFFDRWMDGDGDTESLAPGSSKKQRLEKGPLKFYLWLQFHSGVNVTVAMPLSLHLQEPQGIVLRLSCNVKNTRQLWDLEGN